MACRKINNRYANEGYIIKEIDLEELCKNEKTIPRFPDDRNLDFLQELFGLYYPKLSLFFRIVLTI